MKNYIVEIDGIKYVYPRALLVGFIEILHRLDLTTESNITYINHDLFSKVAATVVREIG